MPCYGILGSLYRVRGAEERYQGRLLRVLGSRYTVYGDKDEDEDSEDEDEDDEQEEERRIVRCWLEYVKLYHVVPLR